MRLPPLGAVSLLAFETEPLQHKGLQYGKIPYLENKVPFLQTNPCSARSPFEKAPLPELGQVPGSPGRWAEFPALGLLAFYVRPVPTRPMGWRICTPSATNGGNVTRHCYVRRKQNPCDADFLA